MFSDVIALPPGELFAQTNDNSVAIFLSYGTTRILLAEDAEAKKEEEYIATSSYSECLTVIQAPGEARGEMRGDISERLSRPNTKAGHLQRECLAL